MSSARASMTSALSAAQRGLRYAARPPVTDPAVPFATDPVSHPCDTTAKSKIRFPPQTDLPSLTTRYAKSPHDVCRQLKVTAEAGIHPAFRERTLLAPVGALTLRHLAAIFSTLRRPLSCCLETALASPPSLVAGGVAPGVTGRRASRHGMYLAGRCFAHLSRRDQGGQ